MEEEGVNEYRKRTFTFKKFVHSTTDVLKDMVHYHRILRKNRLGMDFQEKIMLAVTAVNGCAICSWFHCKIALESGCTDEEIKALYEYDLSHIKKEDAVAILFAQHYAETEGKPSKKSLQRLYQYYGPEKAITILFYIKMITIGNLLGNTIESFIYRLKRRPSRKGDPLFELILYITGAPLYYVAKNDLIKGRSFMIKSG